MRSAAGGSPGAAGAAAEAAAEAADVEAMSGSSFEAAGEDREKLEHPWLGVPYRLQQVLISWIFMLASIFLLLDFLALQSVLMHSHSNARELDYFGELCNWFGVVSCLLWLMGFTVLCHWLHAVDATSMGLVGAYLKVIAAVEFNIQPATGTMDDPRLGGSAGVWWSNFTGIIFFHLGNMVSCLDFWMTAPPGSDQKKSILFHGNLPVTGMWIYQIATWLLLAANLVATSWRGSPEASWLPLNHEFVIVCQAGGALLLLVGSAAYGAWCGAFRDCRYH